MDLKLLKKIMKEFESSSIDKLEITDKDLNIKLEKNVKHKESTLSETFDAEKREKSEIAQKEETNNFTIIRAPLVGTFYDSPSPESLPFVTIDQRVNKGDVLFILEAMKVMNEIKSPVSGIVRRIHVNKGDMVEYSQSILEIEE